MAVTYFCEYQCSRNCVKLAEHNDKYSTDGLPCKMELSNLTWPKLTGLMKKCWLILLRGETDEEDHFYHILQHHHY